MAPQALFMLACAFPSWSRLLFVMGQGLQAGPLGDNWLACWGNNPSRQIKLKDQSTIKVRETSLNYLIIYIYIYIHVYIYI